MPHVRRVIIEMERADGKHFSLVLDDQTIGPMQGLGPTAHLPKAIYFKPEEALVAWAMINNPTLVAQQAAAIQAAYQNHDEGKLRSLIMPQHFPAPGSLTALLNQGAGARKGASVQAIADDGTRPTLISEEIIIHDQKCDWY